MMPTKSKGILVSGIKPTGKLHLGNYLGAIKQFVRMQKEYHSFIFIADLHALTTVHKAEELSDYIFDTAVDYLTLGIDPKKTVLFKQSDLPQVTELTWIFNCITSMPFLSRAHAYKDAQAKNKEISVGTFDYPILMASDILIHGPSVVPVGQDQKQHVEYARDIAEKFNRTFGKTFKIPESYILENAKTVTGTDGRKMSKSYKNTISIFAEDEEIKKAVMSIPTDSKSITDPKDPEKDITFSLLKFFADPKDLEAVKDRYLKGGMGYKEAKEILIKNLIKFISPLREKREEIMKNKKEIRKILEKGAEIANKNAEETMKAVRRKVGISNFKE